jgi:hypothetical protein
MTTTGSPSITPLSCTVAPARIEDALGDAAVAKHGANTRRSEGRPLTEVEACFGETIHNVHQLHALEFAGNSSFGDDRDEFQVPR